jgi:S-adenosylmethionine:tRNA ribosyltransferase-isomerase
MTMSERLQDYNFELPEELIAQKPVEPRDASRLLVVDRKSGTWAHRHFRDLSDYLDADDLLVANNTKVLKARLLGNRILKSDELPHGQYTDDGSDAPPAQFGGTSLKVGDLKHGGPKLGGKVEFLMLEEKGPRTWDGLFHASAKYVPGVKFQIPTPDGLGIVGTIVKGSAESPSGTIVVEFDRDPVAAGAGELPLPKYIRRSPTFIADPGAGHGATAEDDKAYQTVYSKELGSAAAPTAGLHFTPELVRRLRDKGVGWEEVTLHVGVGTFRPVKTENIAEHVMHEERYEIKPEVARAIAQAKSQGRRIVAVGTTSVRTLESAVKRGGSPSLGDAGSNLGSNVDSIHPSSGANSSANSSGHSGTAGIELNSGFGRTSIFIRPGHFEFQVVDRLITNFHLPQSTLLMLVSTFAGRDLIMAAYKDAVRERYRFFSYGDAMLIL